MKSKILKSLFLALSLILILTVWAYAQELADEQVVTFGQHTSDIGTLDPHGPLSIQDGQPKNDIHNKLVRFTDPGNYTMDLEGELATDWDLSENGRVYTFKLRQGVNWHKGYGEFTAEDVQFSFERASNPDTSVHTSDFVWSNLNDVEIVDKYTVKITLKEPDPLYLTRIAALSGSSYILCKKAVEELGEGYRLNPIGTGPFQFEEYRANDQLVLVRNEDYFEGKPIIEKIIYRYMPSNSTRDMAMKTGDLDAARGISDPSWVEQMEADGMIVDMIGPGFTGLLVFNLNRPPLDNKLVRQAVAYAINREELTMVVGGIPQISPVPETWLFSTTEGIPRYDYDLEKAKEKLVEAGYPDGVSLGTQYISESFYYISQMEVIQAQLERAGINLDLMVVDHTTFHANQRKDVNPLPFVGYGPHYEGGTVLQRFFHSSGDFNFSHYDQVDNLLDSILGKTQEEQNEICAEIQRKIMDDLAAYPTITTGAFLVRQAYLDLGYDPVSISTGFYKIIPKTKLIAK